MTAQPCPVCGAQSYAGTASPPHGDGNPCPLRVRELDATLDLQEREALERIAAHRAQADYWRSRTASDWRSGGRGGGPGGQRAAAGEGGQGGAGGC